MVRGGMHAIYNWKCNIEFINIFKSIIMRSWPSKYKPWAIINWHKIIDKIDADYFLIECWTCWEICKKSRSNILKSVRCMSCKNVLIKSERHIPTICWMLWLKEELIRGRITRWMTTKQAFDFKWKISKESFRDYDLVYITKFNTENHEKDTDIANKAYLKYKTKVNNNI